MKEMKLYIKPEKQVEIKKKRKEKKRLEFMQKVVLFALALPFLWVTCSYILAFLEKENPLEYLSGYVVTVPITAIIGYITQNSIRSASYNRMQSEIIKTETIQETPQEDTMMKERENRGT